MKHVYRDGADVYLGEDIQKKAGFLSRGYCPPAYEGPLVNWKEVIEFNSEEDAIMFTEKGEY